MARLLTAILLTLVIVTVYGFMRGDRMSLSTREEKPRYVVVVSVPDITERYDRIALFACAAEVTENGTYCLSDGWEAQSETSARADQSQYPFSYLNWPRGTKHFQAAAVDRTGRVLVTSTLTVFR